MATTTTRRLRAFKRWMRSQGIDYSDALDLIDHPEEGISVRTLCDLYEGDLVATIPKQSCLTIKNSGARRLIEVADLEGYLGLSVALMYEKSLGDQSPWFGYLQLLPQSESIPLLWSLEELDSMLSGTELNKIVKDDKVLVLEDWKECILPLLASYPVELNPDFFSAEHYIAARSLIASRSFEMDDYHGFGMVPLADLFNHKTGAEDVHITYISSHLVPENDVEDNHTSDECENIGGAENNQENEYENAGDAKYHNKSDEFENASVAEVNHKNDEYENTVDGELLTQNFQSRKGFSSDSNRYWEGSSASEDDPVLQMIIVKNVESGAEVFNTYGSLGNAALLHRYGFTEADNPYDIINLDLELVLQWSSSLFSGRHSRIRLSMWRRLGYSGCVSQDSEYFEISLNGEPQVELLILLYIVLLPEEAYCQLDLTVSTAGNLSEPLCVILGNIGVGKPLEMSKDLLLTKSVRDGLLSLANIRESFYGSNSIENDIETLNRCCRIRERKLYHSFMLRVSERRILQKLRTYAASGPQLSRTLKRRTSTRKKLKNNLNIQHFK